MTPRVRLAGSPDDLEPPFVIEALTDGNRSAGLEWLRSRCVGLDGVVVREREFPRTPDEWAHLAADWGGAHGQLLAILDGEVGPAARPFGDAEKLARLSLHDPVPVLAAASPSLTGLGSFREPATAVRLDPVFERFRADSASRWLTLTAVRAWAKGDSDTFGSHWLLAALAAETFARRGWWYWPDEPPPATEGAHRRGAPSVDGSGVRRSAVEAALGEREAGDWSALGFAAPSTDRDGRAYFPFPVSAARPKRYHLPDARASAEEAARFDVALSLAHVTHWVKGSLARSGLGPTERSFVGTQSRLVYQPGDPAGAWRPLLVAPRLSDVVTLHSAVGSIDFVLRGPGGVPRIAVVQLEPSDFRTTPTGGRRRE